MLEVRGVGEWRPCVIAMCESLRVGRLGVIDRKCKSCCAMAIGRQFYDLIAGYRELSNMVTNLIRLLGTTRER